MIDSRPQSSPQGSGGGVDGAYLHISRRAFCSGFLAVGLQTGDAISDAITITVTPSFSAGAISLGGDAFGWSFR